MADFNEFHRSVPMHEIPDDDTLPAGVYELQLRDFQFMWSQAGKYTINFMNTISNGAMEGFSFPIMSYTIGTDDDQKAEDPQTWKTSFGAREWKQALNAMRISFNDMSDPVVLCNLARGKKYQVLAVVREGKGDYIGTVRNRITKYAALGEEVKAPTTVKGGGAAPRPQQRTLRPQRPSAINGTEQHEPDDIEDPAVPAEATDHDNN